MKVLNRITWATSYSLVFIHARVVEEAENQAVSGGGMETGGMLIGRLCRDADAGDLFLEVTAQVPARHTVATGTSIRFPPESWAEADTAIALRNKGERLAGWHHCHPAELWACRNCPAARRAECPASRPFFSMADWGPIKFPLVQFTHAGDGGPEPAARGEGLSRVVRRLAPEGQCRAGDGG